MNDYSVLDELYLTLGELESIAKVIDVMQCRIINLCNEIVNA